MVFIATNPALLFGRA